MVWWLVEPQYEQSTSGLEHVNNHPPGVELHRMFLTRCKKWIDCRGCGGIQVSQTLGRNFELMVKSNRAKYYCPVVRFNSPSIPKWSWWLWWPFNILVWYPIWVYNHGQFFCRTWTFIPKDRANCLTFTLLKPGWVKRIQKVWMGALQKGCFIMFYTLLIVINDLLVLSREWGNEP